MTVIDPGNSFIEMTGLRMMLNILLELSCKRFFSLLILLSKFVPGMLIQLIKPWSVFLALKTVRNCD